MSDELELYGKMVDLLNKHGVTPDLVRRLATTLTDQLPDSSQQCLARFYEYASYMESTNPGYNLPTLKIVSQQPVPNIHTEGKVEWTQDKTKDEDKVDVFAQRPR